MAVPQAAAPPVVVVVNRLADLLADSYSVDDTSIDIEEFFARYRQWLGIHNNRFANAAEQVAAIKYVLSGTALQWFNDIPAANMPATELLRLELNGKSNWKNVNIYLLQVYYP